MTSTAARGAAISTSGIPIVLPVVPPKQMSHNTRVSRWDTSRVSKSHRAKAKEAAEKAIEGVVIPPGMHLQYDVDVYWGAKRLRCDEDGLSSMMKPILDGIADALGTTSDRQLHIGMYRQGRDPAGKGWMLFTLREDTRTHDCGRMSIDDYDSSLRAA